MSSRILLSGHSGSGTHNVKRMQAKYLKVHRLAICKTYDLLNLVLILQTMGF
jgi:hypothetical protein